VVQDFGNRNSARWVSRALRCLQPKEVNMFQRIFAVIAIAGLLGFACAGSLEAADCGGNVACSCGDHVVASRTLLSGVDAVVGSVCPLDGLVMNTSGVVLDFNGNKIVGSGVGTGVLILVDSITIKDGDVFKFGTGIGTAGTTNGSIIDDMKPDSNSGDGIFLRGDNNELSVVRAKTNGNNGVVVIGNHNKLEGHNDEYSGFHGIFVQGDHNELIANLASENANKGPGSGIRVEGNGNILMDNKISKLNTSGIAVVGNGNLLDGNLVRKQQGDGITVDGNDNVLTDNKAVSNKGIGIRASGAGNAGDSTGNAVDTNRIKPQCIIYGVTTPPTCLAK
jgi:hypothetical protein